MKSKREQMMIETTENYQTKFKNHELNSYRVISSGILSPRDEKIAQMRESYKGFTLSNIKYSGLSGRNRRNQSNNGLN